MPEKQLAMVYTWIFCLNKNGYTELQVTTNFSFLRGGFPSGGTGDAGRWNMGYTEIAITDRNTLAGIVRAHAATKVKTSN